MKRAIRAVEILVCAGGFLVAAGPAAAQGGAQPQAPAQPQAQAGAQAGAHMSPTAKKLFDDAAAGSAMEVELGKIAAQKAQSQQVRDFAQTMVNDHGQLLEQMKPIAERKSVAMPSQPKQAQQATIDRLSKLSGAAFDQAYMRVMVEDHSHDVTAFKNGLQQIKDPEMKQWASDTLRVFERHLQLARDAAQSVGVDVKAAEQKGTQKAKQRR